jgi:shikimate kinase
MNIVLIGYRGSGKSVVGQRLAERLGRPFIDVDVLIEKRQKASIQKLVESSGWAYFREVEKKIIDEVCRRDSEVIAPGGGAVLDPENVNSLKRKGLVIWLKAEPGVLAKRLEGDAHRKLQRPTLTGKGTVEELEEVLLARMPYYQKAADAEIDTSTLDPEEVVEKALRIIQRRREEAS